METGTLSYVPDQERTTYWTSSWTESALSWNSTASFSTVPHAPGGMRYRSLSPRRGHALGEGACPSWVLGTGCGSRARRVACACCSQTVNASLALGSSCGQIPSGPDASVASGGVPGTVIQTSPIGSGWTENIAWIWGMGALVWAWVVGYGCVAL